MSNALQARHIRAHYPKAVHSANRAVGLLVLSGFLLLSVTAYLLLALRLPSDWPTVPGNVISVRIVPMAVGVYPMTAEYRGEALLQYSVNGHSYTVWANAGIIDSEPAWVEHRTRSSNYRVRYNPKHPEQAEAMRE